MSEVPVITIDGPSGSGKGTIARRVAGELGWHLLDGVGAWVAGRVCMVHGAPLHACVDPWGAPCGRGDGGGSEGS